MEPKTQPVTDHPRAAGSPVMDVVSPPAETNVSPPAEVDPLEQLAAEDRAAQQAETQHQPAKASKSATPAKPRQPRNGVGLAIAATVIIVLGLAALATYAYLQTV